MRTLRNLREKIERLESEKAGLQGEVEKLKEAGAKKANALEDEVSTLRKEVESLKKLLDDFE